MKTENLCAAVRDHCAILAKSNDTYYKALDYFLNHPTLKDKPTLLIQEFARQKADQVAWLSSLAATKRHYIKSLGFPSMNAFYLLAIELINQDAKELRWHKWKLTSLAGLIKRLTPFKKACKDASLLHVAFETLISKKIGNENAMRLGDEQQAFILILYSDPIRKLGYERTFKTYSDRATEMIRQGFWKEEETIISIDGLRAFLIKPKIKLQWYAKRNK